MSRKTETTEDALQKEFETAEALGKIKTVPQAPEIKKVEDDPTEVIDNPATFEMAVANAQMQDLEYIEVSERLFKFLVKKSNTPYITYGKPGIKVFKVGTRDEIEAEEALTAENRHDRLMKRKAHGGA